MSTWGRVCIGMVLLAALSAGGAGLLRRGIYGWTVFVLAPVILGALAGWVAQPETVGRAGVVGALTVLVTLGALLGFGLEGAICIVMAAPLALPLGALGGWLVYRMAPSRAAASGGAAMLLLLAPAGFTWDTHARPPVFTVRTAIEIAASPEQVWRRMVAFAEMPEPREWYFRAGLAYPTRARIDGAGRGATRYCEFSTGPVVEPIDVWDRPRRLRFHVTQTPSPMREWSPYAQVQPKHLHGYMISRAGEFRLTPLPGNRALLEGTSWYQHGLWPAEYWRWWSDAIVHRIHLRVFRHIQAMAEADARGQVARSW